MAALNESLRPIGVHLIEHFVWTQQRQRYVRGEEAACLLVVDELWLTLRSPEDGQWLETIARKGPKYWFGLVCASLEPADCLTSPYGQAIISNSSTCVLLALDSTALEAATDGFGLRGAAPGEALILSAGERVRSGGRHEQERQLASLTPAELAERNRRRRQRGDPSLETATASRPRAAPSAVLGLDPTAPISLPARRGRS